MLNVIGDPNPEVIIDAGHGGTDPGAGANGIIEKHLNLTASLYMYKRFGELGIKRALTRDKDITIEPADRTRMIRNSKAKYCISNHINAGGGDGAEVIHSIFSNPALATAIANGIVSADQNLRRIFTRKNSSGKDYYFLHRETGSVNTVIVEYFFLDSKVAGVNGDVNEYKEEFLQWVEGAVKGYCQHTGRKYTAPGTTIKPPVATKPTVTPTIQDEISVRVDGVKITPGYLIDGVSYAPVRALAESLGATIGWDATSKTADITRNK